MTDLPPWRELAREVEQLFGAPMAESEEWNAGVEDPSETSRVHIDSRAERRRCPGCGTPGWVKDEMIVDGMIAGLRVPASEWD